MNAYAAHIESLYLGYLGRPADPDGLAYWEGLIGQPGHSLTEVGEALAQSAEFTGGTGQVESVVAVDGFYFKMFGRAADAGGLLYWVDGLRVHDITLGQVVDAVATGARGSDLVAMYDKLVASHAITSAASTPEHIVEYRGPLANEMGKIALSSILDDASLRATLLDLPHVSVFSGWTFPVETLTVTLPNEIQNAYLAYLGRPADAPGLAYWRDVVYVQDNSLDTVSQAFSHATEFAGASGALTARQSIDQIYQNLFGRPADSAGADYWLHLLDTQQMTLAQIVDTVIHGALDADLVAVHDKLTVATAFTAALTSATRIDSYQGAHANQVAHDFLAGVTDDASMAAALAQLDTVIGSLSPKPGGPPLAQAHDAAVALVGVDTGAFHGW